MVQKGKIQKLSVITKRRTRAPEQEEEYVPPPTDPIPNDPIDEVAQNAGRKKRWNQKQTKNWRRYQRIPQQVKIWQLMWHELSRLHSTDWLKELTSIQEIGLIKFNNVSKQ